MSKWVEALPCIAADSRNSKKMFQEIIFPRIGVPRVMGVDHRVATPYHSQTSGQAETSNKYIKNILQKIVNAMGKGWKCKLPEAL
jgi:hypothetical protein